MAVERWERAEAKANRDEKTLKIVPRTRNLHRVYFVQKL